MSCLCCTAEDQNDTKKELLMMADKLDKIEKALKIQPTKDINGSDSALSEPNKKLMRHPTVQLISDKVEEKEPVIPTKKVKQSVKFESQEKDEDNDWENPYWIQNHPENKKSRPPSQLNQ